MKYYLDTAIWIDLYENRKGYHGEPLGDYAFKLLVMIKSKRGKIIITERIIRELESNYSIQQIMGMIKPFEDMLEKIVCSRKQHEEAKIIAIEREVPKGDALHAIAARDNGSILITRDNHFRKLDDIHEHHRPEDLI